MGDVIEVPVVELQEQFRIDGRRALSGRRRNADAIIRRWFQRRAKQQNVVLRLASIRYERRRDPVTRTDWLFVCADAGVVLPEHREMVDDIVNSGTWRDGGVTVRKETPPV